MRTLLFILGFVASIPHAWSDLCERELIFANARSALHQTKNGRFLERPVYGQIQASGANLDFYSHNQTAFILDELLEPEHEDGPIHIVAKRVKEKWFSWFGLEQNNMQDDPRNFISIFGRTAARLFSFAELENPSIDRTKYDAAIQVPSVRRLNNIITRINRFLENGPFSNRRNKMKIGVHFAEVDGKQDGQEYLESFEKEGLIPISVSDPMIRIHDYAAHVPSLILPAEVFDLARRQTRALLRWERAIKEKHPELYSDPKVKDFFRSVLDEQVGNVDNLGNVTSTVVGYSADSDSRLGREHPKNKSLMRNYLRDLDFRVFDGNSPEQAINRLLRERGKALPEELKAATESFTKENASEIWFTTSFEITEQFLAQAIRERRVLFENLARLLEMHPEDRIQKHGFWAPL